MKLEQQLKLQARDVDRRRFLRTHYLARLLGLIPCCIDIADGNRWRVRWCGPPGSMAARQAGAPESEEIVVSQSRREFLVRGLTSASAVAAAPAVVRAGKSSRRDHRGLARRIVREFKTLPGRKGLKIVAPAATGARRFVAKLNQSEVFFVASSIKVFVLAEYLRLVEAGQATLDEQLVVDESVFSPGSPILNPPHLRGEVSALTALQAMISRSDNTATDMALNRVGADRVRAFIASMGLHHTRIPTTTRQLFAYLSGSPDWQNVTWDQLVDLLDNDPYPTNRPLNDIITMASTPNDFISFYRRAIQGEFFDKASTLDRFREVLALPDVTRRAFPLGVNAFLKGGSIDWQQDHALSIQGGLYIPDRWVYYSLVVNWTSKQAGTTADVGGPFTEVLNSIFTQIRDELSTDY